MPEPPREPRPMPTTAGPVRSAAAWIDSSSSEIEAIPSTLQTRRGRCRARTPGCSLQLASDYHTSVASFTISDVESEHPRREPQPPRAERTREPGVKGQADEHTATALAEAASEVGDRW